MRNIGAYSVGETGASGAVFDAATTTLSATPTDAHVPPRPRSLYPEHRARRGRGEAGRRLDVASRARMDLSLTRCVIAVPGVEILFRIRLAVPCPVVGRVYSAARRRRACSAARPPIARAGSLILSSRAYFSSSGRSSVYAYTQAAELGQSLLDGCVVSFFTFFLSVFHFYSYRHFIWTWHV